MCQFGMLNKKGSLEKDSLEKNFATTDKTDFKMCHFSLFSKKGSFEKKKKTKKIFTNAGQILKCVTLA